MWMKEAEAGDVLTAETARMDMICTDLEGNKVVVDRFVDHKTCEIGDWSDYTQSFLYQLDRARYDELTFTGEMYTRPTVTFLPGP